MEQLVKVLELPLVQVLIGATISAWVALKVASRGLEGQSRQAKLELLTRIDRDLLEMLRAFDPLPYHADESGRLVSGGSQIDNFAKIRDLYFKHSTLIAPSIREEMDKSFARAETAYLFHVAPSEPSDFRRIAIALANERGAEADDLLEMASPELRQVVTEFCGELRGVLLALRDQNVEKIQRELP